jgi:hypothetical protein
MSVLGAYWQQAEVERRMIMGKESIHKGRNNWKEKQHAHMEESVHKESDNWKEEHHVRMRGRPNDGRVRVLVRYFKWLNIPKCKNLDT